MDNGKTIILKGISRNPYTFTISPWGSELHTTSAVYAVLAFKPPGYSVLYISSTAELASHLTSEGRPRLFGYEGCTHIGVHVEPVVSRRLSKVTDLVASYAPFLNGVKAINS